jgi:K+/H+ antiporter YhaU regulatory subunit KhtT
VTDLVAVAGAHELETDVSRAVRVVGRVSAVTLPDEVHDMEGYDPVSEETKAAVAGRTHLFPRGLTPVERRDRLVTRLKTDHDVGHVDVEMDDGTVTFLALGSRAAGVGPTLAPGTAAVALRADPAGGASPGDIVQVWRTNPEPERVVTAELRAVDDDVATVALDEAEATRLDPAAPYRLITLPAEPRAERAFAAALRGADETMGAVEVAEGSGLVDASLADLDCTVVAVRPRGGPVEAVPARSRTIAAGDTVYVVARPDTLRRLESVARAETAADGLGA